MNEEQQENKNVDEKAQKKKAKDNESANNNAELIRQGAEAASKTNTPWGKAIGAASKIDDKVFGGKVKQKLGDKAGKAMKMAPGGKLAQNGINTAGKLKNIKNGSSAPQKLQNRQGKAINKNIGTSSQSSENSDTSNKDNGESSEKQSGLSKKSGLGVKDKLTSRFGGGLKDRFKSMFSPKDSSEENSTEGDASGTDVGKQAKGVISKFLKMLLLLLSPMLIMFLLFIFIAIIVVLLLTSLVSWIAPVNTPNYASYAGTGDTTEVVESNFYEQQCGSDDESASNSTKRIECTEAQKDFYKELDSVYNDYAKKNVALNVSLIMATISSGTKMEDIIADDLDTSKLLEDGKKEIRNLAEHMVSDNELDYVKYQEYLTNDYVPNHSHLYILKNRKETEEYSDKELPSDKFGNEIERTVQAIMGSYYTKKDSTEKSICSISGNAQATDLIGKTREERIEIVGPIASKVYSVSGVWASVTVGQLIRESGIGEAYDGSDFIKNNNLAGVKCRDSFPCVNGYAAYASLEEAIQDRIGVFNNGFYPDWKSKTTPEEFIRYVGPIYCPPVPSDGEPGCDPNYAEQVIDLINQYDLKKYDTKDVSSVNCTDENIEYKYNGKLTEAMKKVVELAKSRAGSGYNSLCEGWVEEVWTAALGKKRTNMESAYAAWEKFGVSEDKENIPPGAMVYTSGWAYYSDGSNPYGHVGIYVGDGKVADQGGIKSLEEWVSTQTAPCNGKVGWIGWGWYNNIDLSK